MKKLISLTLALVLIVTCLSGVVFAVDPIAEITTDGKTSKVYSVDDLVAAISPMGTSTVTLLADVTSSAVQNIPTCTLDLNGHTWTGKDGDTWVNAVYFNDSKTDDAAANLYTVVKNGTIIGAIPLSCNVGAIRVENTTLVGNGKVALQLTNGSGCSFVQGKWNDGNVIVNSTLLSTADRTISFNSSGIDFSAVKVKIEKSTLATAGKSFVLACTPNIGSNGLQLTPGSYELGKDVVMYYAEGGNYTRTEAPIPTVTGEAVTVADGTHSVTVLGTAYEGLKKATTPATPAPVVPETPSTPATPSVPTTGTPDVEVPKTGASVVALGVMAMVSLAGAVVTKKH